MRFSGLLHVLPSSKLGLYLEAQPYEESKPLFLQMMEFVQNVEEFFQQEAQRLKLGGLGEAMFMMGFAELPCVKVINQAFKEVSPELKEALRDWFKFYLRTRAGTKMGELALQTGVPSDV